MILSSKFPLDGQTIVLDDYLEIRPENREKVQRYIDEGQAQDWSLLHLAGWYLISSEANVRNTLIGQAECAKWGKSTQIGYSPDTFEIWDKLQILQNQAFTCSFWAWSQTNRLDNQVLEVSNYLSIFWKCTGKGGG